MKQTNSDVYEVSSLNVAAGVDAAPFNVSGERVTIQILDAPQALCRVMGSVDGGTFVNLQYEPAAGGVLAAINNVGAGIYEVYEQVRWVRFGVNQDGTPNRLYRAIIMVHEHD